MIDGKCFCDLGFHGTDCEKFIIWIWNKKFILEKKFR